MQTLEPTPRHFPAGLTPRLRRLCVLAGLALALLPPALYYGVSRGQLGHRARARADGLAAPISRLAAQQPRLWRYNLIKVVQATSSQRDVGDLGQVRITDCAGSPLLEGADLRLGGGDGGGPAGWAPVVAYGQVAAWVSVRIDASAERRNMLLIALGSSLMGLLLGLYLYAFPVREVRAQATELERLLEQLAAAEARLSSANSDLQIRVREAVAATRALSERVLSIQEAERQRIARDLHDGLGQQLTALRLTLERSRLGEHERLEDAVTLCADILTALRHAVFDLRPLELDTEEVTEALRATAERFELRTGIATSFRLEGAKVHALPLATGLLRVLQEALTNAARHGQATEIGVRLEIGERQLELTVHDDGCGFLPEAAPRGVGLTSMAERVDYLGGQLAVISAPGAGTTVRVLVPLQPATAAAGQS